MADHSAGEVTRLLDELEGGDRNAAGRLTSLAYDELRRLAAHYMQVERPDHTLQPTALVHEAYVRLADRSDLRERSRTQFLGIAAQAMRRVLVDHARRRGAAKRGGGRPQVTLDESLEGVPPMDVDILALEEALARLEHRDPRAARVVELRYFAGLDTSGVSAVLGISPATVKRDWLHARAWLRRELDLLPDHPSGRTAP